MWSTTTVEGFHGTTLAAAQSIERDGFKLSEKRWDWLGDGVYFFQDGPYRARALEWAVAVMEGRRSVGEIAQKRAGFGPWEARQEQKPTCSVVLQGPTRLLVAFRATWWYVLGWRGTHNGNS